MVWKTGVYFPAGVRDFSLLHSVQTFFEAHSACNPMGIEDSFSWARAAAA
jgi:hypothetical protein